MRVSPKPTSGAIHAFYGVVVRLVWGSVRMPDIKEGLLLFDFYFCSSIILLRLGDFFLDCLFWGSLFNTGLKYEVGFRLGKLMQPVKGHHNYNNNTYV